jgi:hypothetical protein
VLYTGPACWAYHKIHCFEEVASDGSTTLTLDLAPYSDARIVNGPHGYAYLENMKDPMLRAEQVCGRHWCPAAASVALIAPGTLPTPYSCTPALELATQKAPPFPACTVARSYSAYPDSFCAQLDNPIPQPSGLMHASFYLRQHCMAFNPLPSTPYLDAIAPCAPARHSLTAASSLRMNAGARGSLPMRHASRPSIGPRLSSVPASPALKCSLW